MNFLNLHTDFLRSVDYLGAEPLERATWLNLMAWCATQENGGIIPGAADWKDRKWMQLCGITREEAHLESELYHFDEAGNMVVNHYPTEKENEVRANRENGKKGGRPKKKTPPKKTPEKPRENPPETTRLKIAETEGKDKGREWKDKEKGGEGETREALIPAPSPLPPSDREFCLLVLCEFFPHAPRTLSPVEEDLLGRWSTEILDLAPQDGEACYCWFRLVTDHVRGRKKWPRSREEFLTHYAEAMEKIREWWQDTGEDWFEEHKAREAKKALAKKALAAPREPPPSFAEARAILTDAQQ